MKYLDFYWLGSKLTSKEPGIYTFSVVFLHFFHNIKTIINKIKAIRIEHTIIIIFIFFFLIITFDSHSLV